MESGAGPARSGLPEALVRAAEAEITENGIAAVSMRAIARRVGVSHQAPGHHFRDRTGLLTALAIDGFRRLMAHMTEAQQRLPPEASISEHVAAVGIGYITFADEHPAMFSVMMRPELQRAGDPELARAQMECYSVLLTAVDEARAGGWGAGHSQEELAVTCWALVHGAVTLWRDGDLAIFYPDASIEEIARRITGVLATALAPRE